MFTTNFVSRLPWLYSNQLRVPTKSVEHPKGGITEVSSKGSPHAKNHDRLLLVGSMGLSHQSKANKQKEGTKIKLALLLLTLIPK